MTRNGTRFLTEEILDKALCEESLSREEVLYLLNLDQAEEAGKLFAAARELRSRYFGDKVFLYGFLYFSTWCRNNCAFCSYRTSNRLCQRYRKADSQVIETALEMVDSGVHLLDLTMGEDPFYYGREGGFDSLLDLIKEIKRQTSLPIMISMGAVPDRVLGKLFETGNMLVEILLPDGRNGMPAIRRPITKSSSSSFA